MPILKGNWSRLICNMKKLILLVISAGLSSIIFAKETKDSTNWKFSRQASINFSQISFPNWFRGEKNSIAGVDLSDMTNSKKNKIDRDNSLIA